MKLRIADYLIRIASYLLDRDIRIVPKVEVESLGKEEHK